MIGTVSKQQVRIPAGAVTLDGILTLSGFSNTAVIFAHGSGSSRLSPRNRFVSDTLNNAGIGTLLFDLLTREEDARYDNRFDIDLLTGRLLAATAWMRTRAEDPSIGYFGASTGSASALRAAADLDGEIHAVVSRGGRPDLAGSALARVQSPVLLIVGENDPLVIDLNRRAYEMIKAEKELVLVPGATHLFEEPGALEEAARLATQWFARHLLLPPR